MRVLLPTLLAAALLVPGGAQAARKPKPSPSLLWGTVNICDTSAHPDGVGLRGSMPGTGVAAQGMFMRFQLQYLSGQDRTWHNVGAAGDSGFIAVGSAKFRSRQAGRTFTVVPPASGAILLRGAVTFEWRQDGEVVKRKRLLTSTGRGATAGADPAGYSAATCAVTAS